MSSYKVHIGVDGVIKGYGENVAEYQPQLSEGDSIVLSDNLPSRSSAELFILLRAARDGRLSTTDKYLLTDYPISTEALALVKAYRAALRALPEQTGAPWDGGGEGTPWPSVPKVE